MRLTKLLRRATGVLCAVAGVGLFVLSGSLSGLWDLSDTVSQTASAQTRELTFWERLVLRQSPFLSAGVLLTDSTSTPTPSAAVSPSSLSPSPTPFSSSVPSTSQNEEDSPLSSTLSPTIIPQTIRPSTYGSLPSADGVYLQNRTNQSVDMTSLASAPISLKGSKNGPSILIIHTHSTESYTQTAEDRYEESDAYRTTDTAHNVVRVGDEMAAAFARAGLNVLHDRNLYDYPNYNGAYTRSKAAIEQYLELYPSISVILDVHRDALIAEDGSIYKVVADPSNAENCAQVMLVVGTEEAGGSHPNWRQNLSFAIGLERRLNDAVPTLARPITLRKSHYNQQLSPGSILVEVGTHGNTLEEAVTAAQRFAETAAPYISALLPD